MSTVGSTVESIEVEHRSLPLHTPFVTALRRATSIETVVVRVCDSAGRVGYGEAPQVWQVTGDSVAGSLACLEGPLREAVLGADVADAWPLVDRAVVGNRSAKAALDSALHDLEDHGPLTLPTVLTLPLGDPDEVAATAAARVAEGFTHLKLKVGTSPDLDLARVRAARASGATVRVDANQGWDCHEAVRVLDTLAGEIELVEQPVPAHDLLGLAHVRRHAAVPVMADESVFDLHDLVEVVRHDAADLVNLKLAKAGGVTPALELARVARLHGIGVTVGCMLESGVGVRAAARLAERIGCDVVPDLDGAWWLAEPAGVSYRQGALRVEA